MSAHFRADVGTLPARKASHEATAFTQVLQKTLLEQTPRSTIETTTDEPNECTQGLTPCRPKSAKAGPKDTSVVPQ